MKKIIILITGLVAINLQNRAQTVNDTDGNIFNTITIGTQTWLTENLKTTKFNDGSAIPLVTIDSLWEKLSAPAYCNFTNTANADTINMYGRLYNWYAVNTNKLCPTGWHVPNDSEWTVLTTYLGGDTVAGGRLKETGTIHWISPNTAATNDSKFTAMPGGFRDYNGQFFSVCLNAIWWSATEHDTGRAWLRYIYYYFGSVYREFDNKHDGYSIRCLRD